MRRGRVPSGPCARRHDGERDQPSDDVGRVQAGEHVEGEAVEVGPGGEVGCDEREPVERLRDEEGGAEQRGKQHAGPQGALAVRSGCPYGRLHREARDRDDEGADPERGRQRRHSRRGPCGRPRADHEVTDDRRDEQHRQREDQQFHAQQADPERGRGGAVVGARRAGAHLTSPGAYPGIMSGA